MLTRIAAALMLVAGVALAAPATATESYSQEQINAAVVADHFEKAIAAASDQCTALMTNYPDLDKLYPFLKFFSVTSNAAMASAKVLGDQPQAADGASAAAPDNAVVRFAPAFAKGNVTERGALCANLINTAMAGKLEFDANDPSNAAVLKQLVAGDHALRIALRNADFTIGCMKKKINSNVREYVPVKAYCECATNALTSSASDDELDAWVASIPRTSPLDDAHPPTPAPWYPKLASSLKACPSPRSTP